MTTAQATQEEIRRGLSKFGLSSKSSKNLPEHAQDPTQPGNPDTKRTDQIFAEEVGRTSMLWNPFLNRGTEFTFEEREEKGLHGLLPPATESLELQAKRVLSQLKHEASNDLERYETLQQLSSTNTQLFFYTIIHNLKQLAPIIYTPTVGEACQKFDSIYQNSLGMYFDSFRLRGKFRKMLDNWPSRNVQIIVVTDGGRILGLGDLGTNGMGIPIGKIALYVAGGGFHPEHSLPALLDMGTNNEELRKNPFYLGTKKDRITGDEHMAVVEEFCYAVKDKWPHALIQFEDFQTDRAFAILEKLQDKVLCFNDDIQGTAAVVVAGLINGLKGQHTELKDARFLFYGAGSSAVGVAQLLALLLQKKGGQSEEQAWKQIYMMDSKGVVYKQRGDELPHHKQQVAREDGPDVPHTKDLKEVVAHVKPHALIGLTGRGPAFTEEVVGEMCKVSKRPLIAALSNPTSQAEITAEHAIHWSKGTVIFTSGSPFDPVEYEGKTIEIGQANNVLIFPGMGFGAVMAKAKKVVDEMFLAASIALADHVDQDRIEAGTVYPPLEELREVSAVIASSVVNEAFHLGLAQIKKPEEELISYIKKRMWDPEHPTKFESRL